MTFGQGTFGSSTLGTTDPGILSASDATLVVGGQSASVSTIQNLSATDTQRLVSSDVGSAAQLAPPVITSVNVSRLSDTSVLITWNTDIPATSQVEYGTTTVYGTLSALSPQLVTAHSVVLANLLQNTTYHFRVRSDG